MMGFLMLAGMAGGLAAQPAADAGGRTLPHAAPCHAVPALCMSVRTEGHRPLFGGGRPGADVKMDAYRIDARPCRLIGNMDCPARARRTIWRLGESVRDTLTRGFRQR